MDVWRRNNNENRPVAVTMNINKLFIITVGSTRLYRSTSNLPAIIVTSHIVDHTCIKYTRALQLCSQRGFIKSVLILSLIEIVKGAREKRENNWWSGHTRYFFCTENCRSNLSLLFRFLFPNNCKSAVSYNIGKPQLRKPILLKGNI